MANDTKETFEERIKDRTVDASLEVTEQAKQMLVEGVTSVATDSQNAAARYAQSLGDAAKVAAASLENDGYPASAKPVSRAAKLAGDISQSLASYDVHTMANDVVNVARRNPALSLGLAAFAGYVLVKFSQSHSSTANRSE